MQKVIRKEIFPGMYLTCVTSSKYKTGCISVNLITPLTKENASKNALIPRVLRRGTACCPDIQSISRKLDDMYGAAIEPIVRKSGERQCIGFYSVFADDDFLPKGSDVLGEITSFIGEMLISPYTKGGLLFGEYVESEKKNLIDDIRASINDKRTYAVTRLYELMCDGENYGVARLGDEASVSAITPMILTRHYKKLLAESQVEIFYCGAASEERVDSSFRMAFGAIPRVKCDRTIITDIIMEPKTEEPRLFTDKMDVTQGKLSIGFRLGRCMFEPNYAALMVFNSVFGGSVTSKLFTNVREKLHLCYYASSGTDKHKGTMIVTSGVDFSKFDDAYSEIIRQLDEIREGNVTPEELDFSQASIVNSLRSSLDSQSALEALYFDQALSDFRCDPTDLMALVAAVTVEDIRKIAQSVRIDTVYHLEGNGDDNIGA